ncbi:MAG TPA: carbohydrate-binding family 9-like protein [Polyangiaceae bacterium]|nr:carbohydrate-binding family 9-like protein [Polyangiaceae bacterium]
MRRGVLGFVLALSPSILYTGCVGGSKDEPAADQTEALKAYILDKEPADVGTKIGINYDNKITLVGSKVEPAGTVHLGDRVKVTMYWKVDKEIGEAGWKLFTHVIDGSGERILNIDNVGPLRHGNGKTQALPPSSWKAGKVYVDEQEFAVPKKVKTATIQLTTGIWHGEERLPIVAGPHEHDNRGIAATIHVQNGGGGEPPPSTRVPELRVDKLDKGTKINVDGKLDEEAWKTAPSTGAFVDVRSGHASATSPVQGTAKLLWDDTSLYVGFDVKDKDIEGGFKKDEKDPHLWTKDTVEIMVDPDGDGDNKDYYEIQINPQNLVFDSQFDSYNTPKKEPDGPFGHQEWTAKLKSAVTLNGTIDKADDADEGYVVEAAIPWKSFSKAEKTPPEPGQTWRINLYAMENNGGVSWSPILGQGNFHRASRFGRVLFATKGWTAPAPSAAPSGSAPAASSSAAAAPAGVGGGANVARAAALHPTPTLKDMTPKAPGSAP